MKLSVKSANPLTWSLIVAGLGIALSVLITWEVRMLNQRAAERAVDQAADRVIVAMLERINLYQYGLRGVRGHILTAMDSGISRQQFLRYTQTRDIDSEFPGARGFGFIRRVPRADEDAFVAQARADGAPDFRIRELGPHEGERYLIQYIEPLERNVQAVGLDIASESNRREAAIAAIRTGQVRLTGPITLVQATGKPQQSFLILMPIYNSAVIPPTEAGRQQRAFGWSYAPLLMEEVLADLRLDREREYLELRDVTNAGNPESFFNSRGEEQDQPSIYSRTTQREVFGRLWEVRFSVNPLFIRGLNQTAPAVVLTLGLAISGLLALLTRAVSINFRRKQEIENNRERLVALVESSIDGIIGKTLDGVVTSWNKGAERIFGYTEREAVGKTLVSLIVPPDLHQEDADILSRIGRGEVVHHFESRRCRRDGSMVDVSIAVSPIIDEAGEVVGASKTVRDISAQKEARKEIQELNLTLEAQVEERTAELDQARRNLQTVLDSVPSLIGYWDRHLINRVANHAYHEWFGKQPNKIPGMHMKDLLGEELFESVNRYFNAALAGEAQRVERVLPKRGSMRHVLTHYLPDIKDGEVQGFYVIAHDITELTEGRQKLADALRENEALLNTINKQLLYSVTDADGSIIDVNDNFCRACGYEREELMGLNHRIMNSGLQKAGYWKHLWETLRAGNTWRGEICNRTKDGELIWLDSVISPVFDAQGNIERFIAIRIDVTDRKAVEFDLQRLNQLLSNVLTAASEVSIIATDIQGVITIFNTGAQRMLGYSAEEMVGQTTPAIVHLPEEVAERGRELSREYRQEIEGFRVFVHNAEKEGSETRRWTYVRKDGSELQVSLSVTTMRDSKGEVTGYLGIATDITQELRGKQQLTAIRDQLSIAAEVAELGIWTWTLATDSLQWNDRMFEIYDQPKELRETGLTYEHWRQRVHPDDEARTAAALQAAVEGRGVYNPIFRIRLANGKIRHVQASAQVERDKNGNPVRITGINRDVTIQRELEAQMRHAKEQADAASAAKSNFLANMSHEIRTPMNAVLGMLQLVKQTDLNQRQSDYIIKADTAAKSLLGLLNDILDFSKIDAGKLELDIHPFELEPLMRELAVVLSGNQSDKAVEVIFDIDPAIPGTIECDRLRLQQVLINLTGNALKFTEEGQVVVAVKVVKRDQDYVSLEFSVSDSGIGIEPEQLERIFEGFVQGETSTTRRFGGSGLGLVISRQLVEMMGGELFVESERGKGSRFWFTLRLKLAEAVELTPTGPLQDSDLHLLVVEDNAIAADILSRTIRGIGWRVETAVSGAEALQAVNAADSSDDPFDVVLMDWRLPGLDGLTTAERLRDSQLRSKPPVVIMVTAYGREVLAQRQQRGDPPFTDLLTKPVTTMQLVDSVAAALGIKQPPALAAASANICSGRLNGIRLLIVEDNELNRQVAQELLVSEGAEVDLAEGGISGVSKALKGKYDLIVMDVQMPDIDGLEATRRIRAERDFAQLPILAMTANASSADRAACLDAGMNDHIGKPIDIEKVVACVLTLLGKAPPPKAPPPKAPPQNTPESSALVVETTSGLEPLDRIIERFGGQLDLYRRALDKFCPDVLSMLDELEACALSGDLQEAKSLLHSLKGLAATLGAKGLSRQAAGLEKELNESKTHSPAPVLRGPGIKILRQSARAETEQLGAALAGLEAQRAGSKGNENNATAKGADKEGKRLSPAQLKQHLQTLKPLLESRNLGALELIAILSQGQPADDRIPRLVVEVDNLEFAAALKTLDAILNGKRL